RVVLAGLDGVPPADLVEHRTDGRIKTFVAVRALRARAEFRDLYEDGDYVALAAAGARKDCVFAFARTRSGAERELRGMTITCVPRLVAPLAADGAPPLGPAVWRDTRIDLPGVPASGGATPPFRNIFTGDTVVADFDGRTLSIAAATLFARF